MVIFTMKVFGLINLNNNWFSIGVHSANLLIIVSQPYLTLYSHEITPINNDMPGANISLVHYQYLKEVKLMPK